MYFYLDLFEPLEASIIARLNYKKLTVGLSGKMLNEIFSLNTRHNECWMHLFCRMTLTLALANMKAMTMKWSNKFLYHFNLFFFVFFLFFVNISF